MGRATAGRSDDPERLARLMDAKKRLIGVDVEALNAQVEAKKEAKQQEKEADRLYAEFSATCQGKTTTREWDLNRPDAQRLELPARLGDSDPRCGAASLQVFDGEDRTMAARVAGQQQQCRAWWDAQMAHAERLRRQQQGEKLEQAHNARHLDALQVSLAAQEAAARARMEAQTAADNGALRAVRAAKQAAAEEAERRAALAELAAAAADPLLNEDPGQAASALSPARVRKDHWKGMSGQQIAAITQQRAAQVEQKRAASAAAAASEAAAAAERRAVQRAVLLQAQAAEHAQRRQAVATAGALREQMAAKAARDAATSAAYANRVTDAFYGQFGRSAR